GRTLRRAGPISGVQARGAARLGSKRCSRRSSPTRTLGESPTIGELGAHGAVMSSVDFAA
ncbi:MAG: hypothetical protein M3355_04500, partial [Actinomycetota bacterium]|nr:hypothetical protein [Actinomycetota bacterium]